ncbi:MAG: tRNA (cytidine(34)-2'-O)-methyltransferase [Phycisphaerae bacterium]|nr:tRNA (cytidine(34)-2'-O)-methyltransferase [Tepidisphaeraceae bacterium]
MRIDPAHNLAVALLQPEIAPNTGNVGRLCVATGAELHLVRPLGFVLDDKQLRRSGMDYWARLRLTVHDDDAALFAATASRRAWLFTSHGETSLWDATFAPGDLLVFGNEGRGVTDTVRERFPIERRVRIPQVEGERCLNLSTAVGVGLYEALRRVTRA